MAEKIRPELLSFLPPGMMPLKILVVESLSYLIKLKEMFPQAELYAVTAELDQEISVFPEGIHWEFLDYLSVPLPYTRNYFDYIISDLTLECAANPQDIAAGFSTFLKETGALLTSFRNIRHWSVLQKLMEGHYYGVVSRLFARHEFENLLYASFYKNVCVRRQLREASGELIDHLVAAGFENEHKDLETEFYLVRADRSMPELSLLKSMYTGVDRQELSRLIHRIEYEVDCPESIRTLRIKVETLNIFSDYLASFIQETVMHQEAFYRRLLVHSSGRQDFIIRMLAYSAREAFDPSMRRVFAALQKEVEHGNEGILYART